MPILEANHSHVTANGDDTTSSFELQVYDTGHLLPTCPKKVAAIRAFTQKAYENYSIRALRPAQLTSLIRLNVLNGLARNAMKMGFPVEGLCRDEYISPFNYCGPHHPRLAGPVLCSPKSLQPTALQLQVLHHPWIDLFPFPRVRDNVLQALEAEYLDEDELCSDLLNIQDNRTCEKPSLILWGESSDERGWEASSAFLKKWGWLVQGCAELIDATNYWRASRGERPLVFKTSL
jgi:hypothetical protein